MTGPRRRDPVFAQVFGKNLARCRESLGVSQEELGFRADLHRTAVGQLERGERVARSDTLFKLAASLGIDPSALFEGLDWAPAEYKRGELVLKLEESNSGEADEDSNAGRL
jgi:transcriptional regulator with XRE-family HTH domain